MDSSLVILAQTSEGSFLDPILSPIVDLWDWLPGLGQVGILIVLAIVCAKLAAWILTGLIGRWVGKTETTVDDELIKLMHRPVFLIVLFLGLGMAVERAGLSEKALWVTTAILKTIGLIVLIGFSIRASRLILDALSRNQDRFPLIQSRTLPLFYNVSLLVIIGGALYFLFIAWNIDATAWLASAGVMNPQIRFGEDLMSRVSYVMMNPGGEVEMTRVVRNAINELAEEVTTQASRDLEDVIEAVFVGKLNRCLGEGRRGKTVGRSRNQLPC